MIIILLVSCGLIILNILTVYVTLPGLASFLRVCQNVPTLHNRHSTCCHRLSNEKSSMTIKSMLWWRTISTMKNVANVSNTRCLYKHITFGALSISTKHIRQFPATDKRSWKQKRGICTPTFSQACGETHPVIMTSTKIWHYDELLIFFLSPNNKPQKLTTVIHQLLYEDWV